MTLAEDVVALQTRLAAAEREYSRAEGARDTAKAVAEGARAELERDFGVTSVAQAEDLLTRLRAELQQLVEDISAQLDGIGVR